MGKGHVHHSKIERASLRRRRFEDFADEAPDDAASFFFDLKLMLPQGMTAADVHRARQTVERRLQRTVRKKDRIVWTADGFFVLIATTDPARAGAAAERIHEDIRAVLDSKHDDAPTASSLPRAEAPTKFVVPRDAKRRLGPHETA